MVYDVKYKMHSCAEERSVCVSAKSKAEAYDKAVYEAIPDRETHSPYSAWVASVTYQNGNYKSFNTFEGNPY